MPNVILQGYIIVPASDLATVIEELDNHLALTRAEEGCKVFEVSQDPSDPTRFNVYEEFQGHASFLKHQERARASKWGSITTNVQRYYEIAGME